MSEHRSAMIVPLRPPVHVEILSSQDAHLFAAERRIDATRQRLTAAHLRDRAAALDKAAELSDRQAATWDAAARGEYPV